MYCTNAHMNFCTHIYANMYIHSQSPFFFNLQIKIWQRLLSFLIYISSHSSKHFTNSQAEDSIQDGKLTHNLWYYQDILQNTIY